MRRLAASALCCTTLALACSAGTAPRGAPATTGVVEEDEPDSRWRADPRAPDAPARPGLFDRLPNLTFASPLATRLDAVPAEVDGFMVIRDLRPLLAGAEAYQPVLDGPIRALVEAGAALEDLPGPDPATYDAARSGLRGLVGAITRTKLPLEQGLVLAWRDHAWTLLLPAGELATLRPLLTASGLSATFADEHCAVVGWPTGHVACTSEAGAAMAYRAGREGRALERALHERLGQGPVDQAVVLVRREAPRGPTDVAMTIYPGLAHVTVRTPPVDRMAERVEPGSNAALGSVEPGAGFVWARLESGGLDRLRRSLPSGLSALTGALDGELLASGTAEPPGLAVLAGSSDTSTAQVSLDLLGLNPAVIPASLPIVPGTHLSPSIVAAQDGRSVLRLDLAGGSAVESLEQAGIAPQLVVLALGQHLALGVGDADAQIARTLAHPPRLRNGVAQTLPPMLVDDLLAQRASAAVHLELDALQAPEHRVHVRRLLAAAPVDQRTNLTRVFSALMPSLSVLTSASAWLVELESGPALHVALTGFGRPGDPEGEAARRALERVLAGEEAGPIYAELAADYPESPRIHAYQARAGTTTVTATLATLAAVSVIAGMAVSGAGSRK